MDRYDIFPHVENCLTMTLGEWMMFHITMHRHYTRYRGRKLLKTPMDWLVLGEIIEDTRPPVIVEIGSFEGGSALWMADLLDALQLDTPIYCLDLAERPGRATHERITWLVGDAADPRMAERLTHELGGRRGMVIEDSDHKYHVTRRLLELYSPMVAPGCYFIVEDTICDVLKIPPFPGPLKAAQEFAAARAESWRVDRAREKYIITHNPMGYLLRMKQDG